MPRPDPYYADAAVTIYLPAGSLILDPYTGSGSALRAAKDLGHRAIGIDSLEWCCERAATRMAQGALPFAAEGADPPVVSS